MARDGAQTAERILREAHRLFMERGFASVSMNDVVAHIGITKPTLYYHYADKEALYAAVIARVLTQMGSELADAIAGMQGNTAQVLQGLVEVIQQHNREDTRMMRYQIRANLGEQWQETLAAQFYRSMMAPIVRVMERGLAHGELAGYSAAELAMMFLCVVEAFHGPEGAARQMPVDAARITQLFLYGVARRHSEEKIHGDTFTGMA